MACRLDWRLDLNATLGWTAVALAAILVPPAAFTLTLPTVTEVTFVSACCDGSPFDRRINADCRR